ncbi:hypothetical protein VDGL01_02715 [Verticillium dahliae]
MPGTPAYRAGHERLDAAISVVRVKSTVAVQVGTYGKCWLAMGDWSTGWTTQSAFYWTPKAGEARQGEARASNLGKGKEGTGGMNGMARHGSGSGSGGNSKQANILHKRQAGLARSGRCSAVGFWRPVWRFYHEMAAGRVWDAMDGARTGAPDREGEERSKLLLRASSPIHWPTFPKLNTTTSPPHCAQATIATHEQSLGLLTVSIFHSSP